ncbi:MAG: tetratricopeptide repeat protein [Blastocatellia bacterium]
MHYKGTKKSLPEIASDLQVDVVVEGTVQRAGDRVRIRAQLVRAATEQPLWRESYERNVNDVLELQSEIARTIARAIQTPLTPAEQTRLTDKRAVNRQAYDDYLQGRYLYWNKRTLQNLEKARGYFQRAIKEDPTYVLAYVGLADCYNSFSSIMYSALPPIEARRQAEEAARKALEFDSQLAEAHATLGYVNHYNWNWDESEREFKRAIELNANYANAHSHYAKYLVTRGDREKAVSEADRARELDPLSLAISVDRGHVLLLAHRYTDAIEQLHRVIAMDPNHYSAYWFLNQAYAANGQLEEAITTAEKAVTLSHREPGTLGSLGKVYALAGRKDDANKILNELLELNRRRYVTPVAMVSVYIGLGDKDQAFVWLEKAFQERSNMIVLLKVLPNPDSFRSDPRFADLLRRVGLAP